MPPNVLNLDPLPKAWSNFLRAVDKQLGSAVTVHCVGGFVAKIAYGIPRRTADVDYIAVVPSEADEDLRAIAGQGSKLANTHKLYFQRAGVADYPENYAERLVKLALGLNKLHLLVMDPYDLVLSKLTRNIDKDREDVKAIAKSQNLSFAVLKERYEKEMRGITIGDTNKHDLTLELWQDYFLA